jgi:hypothetical protein
VLQKRSMKSYIFLIVLNVFSLNANAANSCQTFLSSQKNVDLSRSKVSSFGDVKRMMARANDEVRNRDYLQAMASLGAILEYNPEDLMALNSVVMIQTTMGQIAEARRIKEKVMAIEDKYNEASYVSYAQILILDGTPQNAIQYLTAVLEREPKHPVALGLISRVYLALGQLALAKTYIDEKGLLDINDPNYQVLLFEYYYRQGDDRADFYKKSLGVAKNMQHSHKPKKDQTRIPRAYRKSLALKAKAIAALNESKSDLQHALKDMKEYESYNQFTSGWSILLQAEILFKLGRIAESRDLLVKLLSDSTQRDLLVLAALVHIETQGKNIAIDNELINLNLAQLSPLELLEVSKLSANLNWDYIAPDIENSWFNTRIVNQFWYSRDTVLLPVSNFVAKASSVPKRVIRRRSFSGSSASRDDN